LPTQEKREVHEKKVIKKLTKLVKKEKPREKGKGIWGRK